MDYSVRYKYGFVNSFFRTIWALFEFFRTLFGISRFHNSIICDSLMGAVLYHRAFITATPAEIQVHAEFFFSS